MKRKTKTGLKLISQLIDKMPKEVISGDSDAEIETPDNPGTNSEFIQNLMFIYRAYAYFVLEDYDLSIKDYQKAN